MQRREPTTQQSPFDQFENDNDDIGRFENSDMDLSGYADKHLAGLEDFEEEGQEGGAKRGLYALLVLAVVGGFSVLAYYAYQFGSKPGAHTELTLIKADPAPFKEKPENPGGMEVPNQDKAVYDSISGNARNAPPKVERILPPPEEPINRNQEAYKAVIERVKEDSVKQGIPKSIPVTVEPKTEPATELKETVPDVKQDMPAPVKESGLKPVSVEDLKKEPVKVVSNVIPPKQESNARYRIQLGAFKSEADAFKEGERLRKRFASELQGLEYYVQRKDLGEKGIFYGLQAGPFDNGAAARASCQSFTANNQGCFFVEVK